MSKKRLLVLALVVLMCVSVVSGCASGDNAVPPASQAPASEAPADSGAGDSEVGEEAPAAPSDDSVLEIRMVSPLFEAAPDMTNDWWVALEQETNTKWDIEWIPNNDYNTKFDMIIASGDLPEILVGLDQARPTLINAIKQGAFYNLSDYLGDFSAYPNLGANPTPGAWDYMRVDGSIWAVPRSRPQIDLGIKIRKDWLDRLDIPMPTNVDEYRDALVKIVNSDPDGNGVNDTMGVIGYNFLLRDSDGCFQVMFDVFELSYDDNGGLLHTNLKDEYANYVEYMRSLYEAGVMAEEFSVMTATQAEEIFTSGMAASYTRNIWRDYTFEQDIRKVQPEAEVVTIPPMAGPGGKPTAHLAKGVYGGFYMNNKLEEEKLLRILDYFELTCNEYWLDMSYFGIEGIHHEVIDGQKTLTEQGQLEVGTSVQQPMPMIRNTWAKVLNPAAPAAYNQAKLAEVAVFEEVGSINPFEVLVSDTWTQQWPKHEEEFQANVIKAIVGQISMDDFRDYITTLREMPEYQQAFQEFAESYTGMFG